MEYEKEFIGKITGMGMLGYDVQKIINVLDVENEEQFKRDFQDKTSLISKAYQKGVDKSDYIIDSKLYELAKTGDKKAIEMYEKRKNKQISGRDVDHLFRNWGNG
jgi:3-methyladenine DNA glycosylase AlkC